MDTVVSFDQDVMKRFALLKQRARMAHAYLFIGPPGSGKGETAVAVAKMLNCEVGTEELFCGLCPSCRQISAGNHPDVMVISNEPGETIKIEQIRALLERNKLRPFAAAKKVFIIRNIESLTQDAANAFLKTLEEPAADSFLILTTSVAEKNLDTIRSRCQAVYFPPLSTRELVDRLDQDYQAGWETAHFLAYHAQGCYATARKFHEDRFFERKNELIDEFILARPAETRVKALLQDKLGTKELIDIFLSWIRDALMIKSGVTGERLVHPDRVGDLRAFAGTHTFDSLNMLYQSIVKMNRMLADNLNIKIPLLIIGEQLWEK